MNPFDEDRPNYITLEDYQTYWRSLARLQDWELGNSTLCGEDGVTFYIAPEFKFDHASGEFYVMEDA